MGGDRPDESLDAKVFRVGECQKALDRVCKKVGADRITHHDLRHLLATRCIESGGHSDCFALAWLQRRRRPGNEKPTGTCDASIASRKLSASHLHRQRQSRQTWFHCPRWLNE